MNRNDLKDCREEIDRIDKQILALFSRRMTVCQKIGEIKKENHLPIADPQRENKKIETLKKQAPEILQPYIPSLFSTIMALSKELQKRNFNAVKSGTKKLKLLVINGPNINLLGLREPEIYGTQNYTELLAFIQETAEEADIEIDCFQSNHEGEIVDWIQAAYNHYAGILINPGGFTHTSIAIMDALKGVGIPAVEIHLSDIQKREDFRQRSYIKKACLKTFCGMGFEGYRQGILFLKNTLENQ